jgi:hypothetical protein
MNKIQSASGTGVFASVPSAAGPDEPQVSDVGQLTGVSQGTPPNDDDDEGLAGSPLSRIHAAAPQYRRSLFRR